MKRVLLLVLFALLALPMVAQSGNKKPGINKENCTFTNKDGKTFNLYGKVKIVEHFPDIKVQIVEHFPDQCGKVKLVEHFPDVKIQIVNSFPDIKVKIVDAFPGVKK